MKKIVCILGSPRTDGNSDTIAERLLATAESIGAQSEVFELNKLNYKGCIACMGCKTGSENCVLNDDITAVIASVKEADVLVMTSPVYCWYINGQVKCLIDRFYSLLKPDFMTNPAPSRLAPGKKCVFITTEGNPDPHSFDLMPDFTRLLSMFGFDVHTIRGIGLLEKTDAAKNADLMKQTEDVARQIMGK